MYTRSQAGEAGCAGFQLPLFRVGGGEPRYKPLELGDVQALVDKLPPMGEGGGLWLSQFDKLTAGQMLALGDWRAVAARAVSAQAMTEIEKGAATRRSPDDTPFSQVVGRIATALRERFPLPAGAPMPKLPWEKEQHPRQYLEACKDTWAKHTGHHPGKGGLQQEWFRRAVLEGLPEKIKEAMMANPDLPGS